MLALLVVLTVCDYIYEHRIEDRDDEMKAVKWIKRLGFWGFMFFLVKGLLWLIVPALVALWASS